MLQDFNKMIEEIAFKRYFQMPPLILFSLSDSEERSAAFPLKVFSKKISDGMGTVLKVLKINPPTEKVILDILDKISYNENLNLSKEVLKDLLLQSNKDLRSAIMTLQFRTARITNRQGNSSKRLKTNGNQTGQLLVVAENYQKDNQLGLFHALGKMLYNKSTFLNLKLYRNKSVNTTNRVTSSRVDD